MQELSWPEVTSLDRSWNFGWAEVLIELLVKHSNKLFWNPLHLSGLKVGLNAGRPLRAAPKVGVHTIHAVAKSGKILTAKSAWI